MHFIFSEGETEYVVNSPKEFTSQCHDEFKELLGQCDFSKTPTLRIDFTATEFIDSRSIGILLYAKSVANEEGGKIVLSSPYGKVKKMFEVSKFDELFEIIESQE
tara:strand:+ start:216 stop:530 length:315 start_codon:yes stop_codon:yes gene_type:complete